VNGSAPFRFGWVDAAKIGKSAGLAAAGALLGIGAGYIANLEATDYAWLVPLATVAVNTLRKFVMDTR
jgi:hypothetical protein